LTALPAPTTTPANVERKTGMNVGKLWPWTAVLGSLLICGCAGISHSKHTASSVVQYLYPDQSEPRETPQIPRLTLPLRVGLAFVPETTERAGYLTENDKQALLAEIADHFRQYDFVKAMEIIPSSYLIPKGSFKNLDQLRQMFRVDVIALISFDQTQFVEEGLAAISYWTLLGAYVVPAEKNTTHTLMDAAVYDIASRKLLFRAPGVSRIRDYATPVNLAEKMRQNCRQGFKEASRDLIANLDAELSQFKHRVRTSPQEFQVVAQPGYRGGGSLDLVWLGLLLALGGWQWWTHRGQRS